MIDLFYAGVEAVYQAVFILLPSSMRVIAFSIFLATVSKWFKNKRGIWWVVAKILLTLFQMGLMMYKFQFFYLMSLGEQILQAVGLVVIFSAVIVVYWGRNLSIAGYRVINYWTLWLAYFLLLGFGLAIEWKSGAIGFSLFYFAVMLISVRLAKGDVNTL